MARRQKRFQDVKEFTAIKKILKKTGGMHKRPGKRILKIIQNK